MPSVIGDDQWDFFPGNNSIGESIFLMPPISLFFFYVWVAWSIMWLAGLILYCFRWHTGDTMILMRSPVLSLLSAIGSEICLTCFIWKLALTPECFPCFLDLFYILIFLPLYIVPFILRFIRYFYTMIQLEKWKNHEISEVRDGPLLQERTYAAILGIFISLCMAIAVILQYTVLNTCVNSYGCDLNEVTVPILIVLLVLCLIIVIIGLFLIRKIPDPYGVKGELISCFISWLIILTPYLILYSIDFTDEGDGLIETVDAVLALLMFILFATGYFTSVIYPISLSFKKPPEEGTKQTVLSTIEQILNDDEAYGHLLKVATLKRAPEAPPFAREILRFRQLEDQEQIRVKAKEIYDMYIKPGSEHQNNLPAAMVDDITARLENPTSDIFNRAYQEVTKLINTNYLRDVMNLDEFRETVEKRKKELQQENIRKQILEGVSTGNR
ncbi:regulator of G protein [Histomonas meleagridis]|uniref:regulator of G protein n=1 Tax=Histomonas meleagridis TaxID=135588 RepID=UPI00355A2004|nr:regulator of G protein [Histomonas meleagridis]KAH0801540.1 regulator of G protein [Histomonas meleagridis]